MFKNSHKPYHAVQSSPSCKHQFPSVTSSVPYYVQDFLLEAFLPNSSTKENLAYKYKKLYSNFLLIAIYIKKAS